MKLKLNLKNLFIILLHLPVKGANLFNSKYFHEPVKKGNQDKMTQIFNEPGNHTHEVIKKKIDTPDLDFQQAKDTAKEIALSKSASCMVLSWKNGKTGEFYPKRQCGTENKPAWIYYAETRGADLTVDINDGEYVFMILLME